MTLDCTSRSNRYVDILRCEWPLDNISFLFSEQRNWRGKRKINTVWLNVIQQPSSKKSRHVSWPTKRRIPPQPRSVACPNHSMSEIKSPSHLPTINEQSMMIPWRYSILRSPRLLTMPTAVSSRRRRDLNIDIARMDSLNPSHSLDTVSLGRIPAWGQTLQKSKFLKSLSTESHTHSRYLGTTKRSVIHPIHKRLRHKHHASSHSPVAFPPLMSYGIPLSTVPTLSFRASLAFTGI